MKLLFIYVLEGSSRCRISADSGRMEAGATAAQVCMCIAVLFNVAVMYEGSVRHGKSLHWEARESRWILFVVRLKWCVSSKLCECCSFVYFTSASVSSDIKRYTNLLFIYYFILIKTWQEVGNPYIYNIRINKSKWRWKWVDVGEEESIKHCLRVSCCFCCFWDGEYIPTVSKKAMNGNPVYIQTNDRSYRLHLYRVFSEVNAALHNLTDLCNCVQFTAGIAQRSKFC